MDRNLERKGAVRRMGLEMGIEGGKGLREGRGLEGGMGLGARMVQRGGRRV